MWKRIAKWTALVVGVLIAAVAAFVLVEVIRFDRSTSRVYDVPVPAIVRSTDPAVIARGKHLAESLGECTVCHGASMGGGRAEPLGPLGTMIIPNVTNGRDGRLAAYSDGELARLIRHGIKRDGRTVRLMPSTNCSWWPDEDVIALVSWLRTVPPVDGDPGVVELSVMAKVLDRLDAIPIDVARRIDHTSTTRPPPPSPDARYGAFVATSCRGCHGATLAGGPIPGAPPGLPVPLNLTRHETGLKGWTYDDFLALLRDGRRKNGKPLDPFMPVESLRNMNEIETRALWAYLQSVPPRPFGER